MRVPARAIGLLAVACTGLTAACVARNSVHTAESGSISIDADNIAGVVTGPSGPEVGEWVIAETNDLSGRGLWTTISTRAPFHMEGGKGTTSKVMKFQLRPDPLAR